MIARAAFAAAVLFLAWQASDVLFLLFGAVLFACALSGAADWVAARTGGHRGLALALVLLAVLATAVFAVVLLGPRVGEQIHQLWATLPGAANQLFEKLKRIAPGISDIELTRYAGGVFGRAAGVFSNVAGAVAAVVLTLFLSIYMASQPALYKRGLLRLFAPYRRERLGSVFGEIGFTLQRWLLGQFVLMSFVGIATGTGLAILGVPLAVTLGLIAGLLDFVPNIGPWIAAVPGILLALTVSPMTALWAALIYLAVQMIENQVLQPLVQSKAVDLPPALIVFSQALLGILFGLAGVVFATPLAAAVRILVERLYVEDVVEAG